MAMVRLLFGIFVFIHLVFAFEEKDFNPGRLNENESKTPAPGSLGKYFVYVNCTTCKVKSDLVVKAYGFDNSTEKTSEKYITTKELTAKGLTAKRLTAKGLTAKGLTPKKSVTENHRRISTELFDIIDEEETEHAEEDEQEIEYTEEFEEETEYPEEKTTKKRKRKKTTSRKPKKTTAVKKKITIKFEEHEKTEEPEEPDESETHKEPEEGDEHEESEEAEEHEETTSPAYRKSKKSKVKKTTHAGISHATTQAGTKAGISHATTQAGTKAGISHDKKTSTSH